MIASTQLRPGMVIKFNNDLFSIFSVNDFSEGYRGGHISGDEYLYLTSTRHIAGSTSQKLPTTQGSG